MRNFALTAIFLLMLGCSERPAPIEPTGQSIAGGSVASTEPRFVFVAPDGFVWNDEHRIWYNQATNMSVTLAHAPGTSFSSVVDDFVADRMMAADMELATKEIRDVDGRSTLLVHGTRLNARYPQEFCTVAFGTSTGCAQLTAIYPAETSNESKNQIETSLLTSRYVVPGEAEQ